MIHVENHHLGRAARLATALDYTGERVEAAHEAHRARGNPAARERFAAAAERREVCARSRAPLEEHAFRSRQAHDGFHIVLDGIDEARGALRLGLHANVEPYGRIERHLLLDEKMGKVIAEIVARFSGNEVAALLAPAHNRIHHAADQLPHRRLALGRIQFAVKIF